MDMSISIRHPCIVVSYKASSEARANHSHQGCGRAEAPTRTQKKNAADKADANERHWHDCRRPALEREQSFAMIVPNLNPSQAQKMRPQSASLRTPRGDPSFNRLRTDGQATPRLPAPEVSAMLTTPCAPASGASTASNVHCALAIAGASGRR